MTDSSFECQRCGHCCHGRGGIVVGPRDLPRLASHFNLTPKDFLSQYTEVLGGKPCLITGEDGFCLFFKEGAGCTIHPARPDVCRAWPFFRGNLIDSISFEMAKNDCPGIDKNVSHSHFARDGYNYLRDNHLLASNPAEEGRALIISENELPSDSAATPESRQKILSASSAVS